MPRTTTATILELNRRIEEVRRQRHVKRLKERLAHLAGSDTLRRMFSDEIQRLNHELSRLER